MYGLKREIEMRLIIVVFFMSFAPLLFADECSYNSHCAFGQTCQSGSCVVDPACDILDAPCYCPGFVGCLEGYVCAVSTGQCFEPECVNDLGCGLGYVCGQAGECIVDTTADRDLDGVPDVVDNCKDLKNTGQEDLDRDDLGDLCDLDIDGDGIADATDNCPRVANTSQLDADSNGIGNHCESPQLYITAICSSFLSGGTDTDNDGIRDSCDKCKYLASVNNFDSDGDGFGDACDPDVDGDAVQNHEDNCPGMPNAAQEDCNCNGMGDACDATACSAIACAATL